MKRLLLLAPALLGFSALAADPAPAEAVPAPSCTKPQIQLDDKGKLKNSKELQAQVGSYGKCIDAYVAERKQVADAHQAIVKANRDAGNAAVVEFNDFAEALRTAQGQGQGQK
jgi:hypothetical protein